MRSETVNIFGGTEVKNLGEPVEGAPTLVIKGTVLFGGVEVKGPAPVGGAGAPADRRAGCRG